MTRLAAGMDSTLFFHPPNERDTARSDRADRAKAICRCCPVIAECLDHALRVREPYGVWGGHTEDERARLLGVQSLRYPAMIRNYRKEEGPAARTRPEPMTAKPQLGMSTWLNLNNPFY